MADVVVVGQIGRDLVLRVDALPTVGHYYVAALTAALLGGAAPEDAAWAASAAAALCVTRAGGRPALSPEALRSAVHRFRLP
jgi:hypothetical protein